MLVRIVAAISALAIVGVLLKVACTEHRPHGPSPAAEDMHRVHCIVTLLSSGDVPMKDGRVDPYGLIRCGRLELKDYQLFHSNRLGVGPTAEEISAGDYTNYAYERFLGVPELVAGDRVPVIWEREPDEDGGRVVGFVDGACRYVERDAFRALLQKYGQLEPAR